MRSGGGAWAERRAWRVGIHGSDRETVVDGRSRGCFNFFDESSATVGAVERIMGRSNPDPDESITSVAPIGRSNRFHRKEIQKDFKKLKRGD